MSFQCISNHFSPRNGWGHHPDVTHHLKKGLRLGIAQKCAVSVEPRVRLARKASTVANCLTGCLEKVFEYRTKFRKLSCLSTELAGFDIEDILVRPYIMQWLDFAKGQMKAIRYLKLLAEILLRGWMVFT